VSIFQLILRYPWGTAHFGIDFGGMGFLITLVINLGLTARHEIFGESAALQA
jgi:hypothetical protein